MTDRTRAIAATVVGGVLGGLAGYLFFTERGRDLRRRLEPTLEDLADELVHFRGTLNKAVGVAGEGWKVVSEVLGEPGSRYPNPRQSAPY